MMLLAQLLFIPFILLVSICHADNGQGADKEGIYVFPETVIFWNVPQGEKQTKKLFVRQADSHSLKITSVKGMGEGVNAVLSESSGREKMAYVIDVSLNPINAGAAIEDGVVIETDHPDYPSLVIPVRGNILDGLVLDPAAFGMIINRSTHLATGAIKISSSEGSEFEIIEVTSSLTSMHTKVVPMDECCGYYIAVLLNDVEQRITRPQQATIHVKTTSKQGVVVIPVMLKPSTGM